jgi:cystathionine beta-lyase/cystathionine gamma-synthase
MARWKKVSKLLYVIVDNTWLTDAIFQPFDIPEVDFVINSLTKYYSGGACIAGVVLGRAHNVMNKVTNWSARNGNHVSPHNCELVVQKLPQLDERIAITSALTLRIIDYLKTKEIVTNISHPVCENHPSHQLAKKYFKQELVPSTFSISIGRKFDFVYKAVKKATILECKTSFGSRMSRTNIWSNQEAGTDSTIVRLSIGYEDNYDRIVSGLDEIFIKLDEK